MRLLHHRVGRSKLLLTFNMILVFVSAFLVSVNLQARKELEESKRGFYSEEAVYLVSEGDDWEEIENILTGGKWQNGILFKKDLEIGIDTRGIFYQGSAPRYPLRSGRFFTEAESRGNEKIALIGSSFQKDVYEQEKKEYIDILGEPFEVIGILGSVQATRLDRMQWIPMGAAAELTGAAGNYVVDGKQKASIQKNEDLLRSVMREDWTMQKSELVESQEESEEGWLTWLTDIDIDTVEKIYLAIIMAFILNMVLACSYWARSRQQKIQVKKLLGFSGVRILLSVLAEYFVIAAVSLAAAGVLMGVLTGLHIVTAINLIECLAALAGILAGGMAVVAIRLSVNVAGKKITLKRA